MRILSLSNGSKMYTSNVYLVTGTWNGLDDVNTLVDVGRDPSIIGKIGNARTGVGQPRVEQVVLTHSHYDHASLLPLIRETYEPTVYAYSRFLPGVDHFLRDGDTLRLGDRMFEVIHTPGHSDDSICLYCEEDRILLAGDTPLRIESSDSSYGEGFVRALERLCRRSVETIYFGHGPPLFEGCDARLRQSLKKIRESTGRPERLRQGKSGIGSPV